ncbi:hypothetical protein BJF78_00740 [Pseudonocardia sp. CNS-139]|nr:hypothetical protein BJF78_00740 [Pseudonocardia sp. CNS-139]
MDGGTAAARIHVEIDAPDALDVLAAHVEALAHVPGFEAQLVAFAQNGITGEPGVLSRMRAALDGPAQVVGGCPYTDRDPLRHLDTVAGLAAERGAPLDLHIDLGDDPAESLLGPAIEAVARHGLSGRATFGHVSTLAAMPRRQAADTARLLRDAGIAVVAIPTTDLWLSGRGDVPSRGVTRMAVLRANGVDVALASNNHVNAFTPISPASLLHVAQLASVACHLGSPEEQRALLDAVTRVPARIVGSAVPDAPRIGAPATSCWWTRPTRSRPSGWRRRWRGSVVRGKLHEPARRRPRTEPERWTR